MVRQDKLQRESIPELNRVDIAMEILAAHQPDAILNAVAMSAKELPSSSYLEQSLSKVIERIGSGHQRRPSAYIQDRPSRARSRPHHTTSPLERV